MTFKTDIKFDESPVLRSLEKVAVDRGLVKPDPITKEASASEVYAPTEDLHEDMLKLVAGLRAKGFEKEAEELEDKINMRKFAETDLYHVIDEEGDELLDFAHPEGDVEVAPSASGLGKVWTEQSAKKEIEKIVRKQPTGKYAARGADIKKRAQEINESAINEKLAEYWDALDVAKSAAVKGLGATNKRTWMFTEEGVLTNASMREEYVERSGANLNSINEYTNLVKVAYGTTLVGQGNRVYKTVDDVYKRISSIGIGDYSAWKAVTTGTQANAYFWGSKPAETGYTTWDTPKPRNMPWSQDNPHSIIWWGAPMFEFDKWQWNAAQARKAASAVHALVLSMRNEIFGERLQKATVSLRKSAGQFNTELLNAFPKSAVIGYLERDENDSLAPSASSILVEANKYTKNLKSLGKGSTFQKRYVRLLAKIGITDMDWGAFNQALLDGEQALSGAIKEVSKIAATGPAKSAASNFALAASIFASYMAWLEREGYQDSKEYAASKEGMAQSTKYAEMVNSGITSGKMGRAYRVLEVDSDKGLLDASNGWLASVQKYTGMNAPMKVEVPAEAETPAEADDTVYSSSDIAIKKAQPVFTPGGGGTTPKPTAPRQPSDPRRPGSPAGRQPASRQPGGAVKKSPLTESIQKELLRLAELGKKYDFRQDLITDLEMKPYGADGQFAGATRKALQAAQKIRNAHAKKSPAIEVRNDQSTVDNLKALISALGGAGSGMRQRKVFDELSNGKKVTSMDLISPKSFYEFMIVAMPTKRQIDTESGLEVVDIKTFESFVKHLLGRARVMYKESTSDEVTKRAGSYIRALKELWAQWEGVLNNVAKQFGGGKGSKITADYVRQVGKIYASSLDTGGPDFGRGEGPGAGTGLRQERGPGGGIRIELAGDGGGRAGEVPEDVVPPITRYINLGDATYWNLDLQVILDYNEFRRMSGTEFANVFFSGEEETVETPGAAGRLPPLDNAVWDEAARRAGWPVVKYNPRDRQFYIQVQGAGRGERGPWAGRWIPAKDDPYTRRQLPEQATPARATTITANDRALNFLRDFRAAITRVYKDWASNVLSGNYEKRKEFSTLILGQARRWQKKISRMENDLKRANMRARRR